MTAKNIVAKIDPKPSAPAPITPMQMLQIAVEQNADLDKLTKLMDLQERWEANEARKAFVSAKAAFSAEVPTINKNKLVDFKSRDERKAGTSYHHATLDNVAETLSPLLGKHGLAYSWETEQLDGGMIRVTCVLTHEMGHSERVSLQAGPDQTGNKNNIQAVGSTVTYLQRYTLLAITGTATKDQDEDGFDGSVKTEPGWHGPLKKTAFKNKVMDLSSAMKAAQTKGELTAIVAEYGDVLNQMQFDRPEWWVGQGDIEGYQYRIKRLSEELPEYAEDSSVDEEPWRLPVTISESGETNWALWRQNMETNIESARDLPQLNTFVDANRAALAQYSKANRKGALRLRTILDNKRGFLAQEPADATE